MAFTCIIYTLAGQDYKCVLRPADIVSRIIGHDEE